MYVFVSRIKRKSLIQMFWLRVIVFITRIKRISGLISLDTKKELGHFWVREIWKDKGSMISYRRSPKHRHLFQKMKGLFDGLDTIQYETDSIPNWDTIVARMATEKPGGENAIKMKTRIIKGFKKMIVMFLIMVLLMIGIMVFIVPSPIDPVAWHPPAKPSEEGALQQNSLLSSSILLAKGLLKQPEDIVFDDQGRLYTGNKDGTIRRLNPENTENIETFAETGGYPLGLQFDKEGHLIAAVKNKGLMSINANGDVALLTDQVEGTPITYANEVAISSDGTVYFTDSSTKYDLGWPFDILEGRPHGRLLSYDPRSKKTRMILNKLYFANGIVLSKNEDYLLISETSRYRIIRYWLKGTMAGTIDVFADNLPNMPDNISVDQSGDLWVGGSKRIDFVDFLQSRSFLKKQMAKLPYGLLKKIPTIKRYGYVLRLDSNGEIKQTLHDPSGNVYAISSVVKKENTLYFGTLFGDFVGQYTLEDVQNASAE
ncbi:SMP-30/gluconolactonase/LRE family protein [Cohnella suwonensis]|uniref:SMP-30/gluconolactonase/LRE family protein n=1 Tax=Cohnella suwonensis TaxID=696072 RepID=A0ABW0LZ07_9BACL